MGTCAIGLGLGGPVWAQETASGKANQLVIDEIIVTAQQSYYDRTAISATKLDLPIIETPQAIFIINDDLIADQQAFRFDQVLQNDSSVQKSNNFLGAYSSYAIRGFDLQNASNYLRDGRSYFHLSAPPVEVLERVEVLKGPSSVLYGTLAPGGLINMVPKRPQAETETSIKSTFGSYDLVHLHVDHGGPLTESGNVRYRINGVYEDTESFRDFSDGSAFKTERRTVSGALDWDISEDTLLRVNADYTDDNRPQDIGLINLTGDFSTQDYDLIISQPWTLYNSDVVNVALEINHQFNEFLRVRAGASYQDFRRDRYDNQIRTLPDVNGDFQMRARRRVNRRDYTTYYADFIGAFETGKIEHQLLIGVDQTNVDIDNNETTRNVDFLTNIFNPQVIPDPLIVTRPDKRLGFENRTGVYAQDMISFSEKWRLLVGGRYDDFKAEQTDEAGNVSFRQEATNFTPRAGLVFLPTENLSFYGSYSESFEPNSPVSPQFDNAGEILDPTVGVQYEAGVKWETLDGKLLATGAVFSIDRKNAPVTDVLNNIIVQTGKQTHEGAEFTVSGLIGETISVSGSGTYLSAEFKADDDPSLIGNTPAGVPEWAFSVAAEYQFPTPALQGLSVQGGWFYESKRPIDNANLYDLDSYHRVDIGLKYVHAPFNANNLIWRLSIQNLTDEEYYKGRSALAVNPERPREIRGSLEIQF